MDWRVVVLSWYLLSQVDPNFIIPVPCVLATFVSHVETRAPCLEPFVPFRYKMYSVSFDIPQCSFLIPHALRLVFYFFTRSHTCIYLKDSLHRSLSGIARLLTTQLSDPTGPIFYDRVNSQPHRTPTH